MPLSSCGTGSRFLFLPFPLPFEPLWNLFGCGLSVGAASGLFLSTLFESPCEPLEAA